MEDKKILRFFCNGKEELVLVRPDDRLLDVLRLSLIHISEPTRH